MPNEPPPTEMLDQPRLPPCNALEQQYEVIEILGSGGMGHVFHAKHRSLPKHAAIKILNEKLQPDSRSRLRFEQEAKAAASLSHPNIVDVYDFGIADDGSPYLIMDYVRGHGLSEIIREEGPLEIDRFISIATQIASALQHAHANGVIHRDIKPANIMLVKIEHGEEFAKLLDFGAATLTKESAAGSPQELTQKGNFIGSPLYMSPEQIRGEQADARSDIYAFGCTMYEALIGKPPFRGETALLTMMSHIESTPPTFAELAPALEIPERVEAVVQRCIAKEPDQRFQSAAELRKELFKSFAAGEQKDNAIGDGSLTGEGLVRVDAQSTGITRAVMIVALIVTLSLIGALLCLAPPQFLKESADRLYYNQNADIELLQSIRKRLQKRQFAIESELQKAKQPMADVDIRNISATIDSAILAIQMRLDEQEKSKQVDQELARSLVIFGDQFRALRDFESAQIVYLCATDVINFLGLQRSELNSDILLRSGIIAHVGHNNGLALKLYDQALQLTESFGGTDNAVAEILGWRAVASCQTGQIEAAKKDWRRATRIFEASSNLEAKAKLLGIYSAQTTLYAGLHEKEAANQAYSKFLSLFEELRSSHPQWVNAQEAELLKKLIAAMN